MIRFLLRITGIENKIIKEQEKKFELNLQMYRQWFYSEDFKHRRIIFFFLDKIYTDFKNRKGIDVSELRSYIDKKAQE